MNKSNLVKIVAEESAVSQADAQRVLKIMIGEIVTNVAKGRKVIIPNLGVFCDTKRSVRVARNPKTGATVSIDEKRMVKFTASKNFKEKINLSSE